jgi:hypothetical protein
LGVRPNAFKRRWKPASSDMAGSHFAPIFGVQSFGCGATRPGQLSFGPSIEIGMAVNDA